MDSKKVDDPNTTIAFFQLPKFMLLRLRKKELSATSMIIYMLLYDRTRISMTNKGRWSDGSNCFHCIYTIQALAEDTGRSTKTVKNCLRELEALGLIERERRGVYHANHIYVRIPLEEDNFPRQGKKTSDDMGRKLSPNNTTTKKMNNVDYSYDFEKGGSL